jgi:hypothetical protein
MDISCYKNISKKIIYEFIPPNWQKDYRSFNRLKIMPFLYKKFQVYEYLLFYELDAFVFRDELDLWMAKGYDYIGAPWKKGWVSSDEYSTFIGVGNGGFSLRKVKSHLKVLNSFSYIEKPKALAARWLKNKPLEKLLSVLPTMVDLTLRNNTYYLFNDYVGNEDFFWGAIANYNFSWFTVAPVDEAMKFSFELNPRSLYLINQNNLPFGCHGWWKYDLDFWRPYLLEEGYIV